MATPAIRMFRKLEGLFCVYKPAGVHWKLVRDSIETNLLKGECSLFFTGILWSCYQSPMRAVKLRYDAANTQHAFNLTLECPCVYYTSGLNAAPSQPLPHEVRLLAQPRHESEASKGLTVSAVSVPVLSKHPLGMYIHLTENVNKCCLRSEDTLTDTLRYIYLTSWSMQLFCQHHCEKPSASETSCTNLSSLSLHL